MGRYEVTLQNRNVQAFLALIRFTEGADYDTLFGGEKVDALYDHPRKVITRMLGGKPLSSTAAGAYQFLSRTWDECAKELSLPDFSPSSQDRAAIYLISRRGALQDVIAGRWQAAISECNREWASLPGSPYGQPVKSLARCLGFLSEYVRQPDPEPITPSPEIETPAPAFRINPPAPSAFSVPPPPSQFPEYSIKEKSTVAPFILAALPSLIQAAPSLIRLFGNGEKAEENAKAAEIVAGIAKDITQEPTIEGAVGKMRADPDLAQKFDRAVTENWYVLTGEAGGGGIQGARQGDAAALQQSGGNPLKSPAFLVSGALLPLVYIVVSAVMFGADWTMEIRAMVVSSIISLVLGAITGYFLGTSFGSQRKTDMLNAK